MDAETLTGGLEKAKYSKDVTNIFQRCHQYIPKMSPKYSKDVTKVFQRCHQNIPKMSPIYSKDVTKVFQDVTKIFQRCHQNLTFFSTQKYTLVLLQSNFFSFNNYLLKRPKVNTHLDRVVFTIIINFQKSKTFIYVKKI